MAQTHSSKAMFSYIEGSLHQRKLGINSKSFSRCFVPDEHPDSATVRGVLDTGIDGLSQKVYLIILGLPSDKFWTEFSVSYVPDGKEAYKDQIVAWRVDIAGKDAQTVIWEVRALVNTKLDID